MRICKKGQKRLKYKSDYILKKVYLEGVLYYSVDGFNFAHSRTQRFNLSNLYFTNRNKFESIDIVEITNTTKTNDIIEISGNSISIKVNDLYEILVLIDKI